MESSGSAAVSWLLHNAAQPQAALLGQRPELMERYRAFLETLWVEGHVPLRLLHLCRLRIAAIHGAVSAWNPVPLPDLEAPLEGAALAALSRGPTADDAALFTLAEQAALQVAELIPHGQHQITDAQVAALQTALGNPAAVALLTALAFFDVNTRLGLSLGLQTES
ncbi:MAG: hypothetical protein AB8B93_03125 [Pseudomonadales bacterium]